MNNKYPFYVVAAFIAVGVFPLPYGYYELLRLVATAGFGYAAYLEYEHKSGFWIYILGFGVILFNPIFKIHLPKEFWMFADPVFGAILAFWTFKTFKK